MIYIFGDSYSEPNNTNLQEKVLSWVKKLNLFSGYRIINYSKSGKGSHFLFKHFFSVFDNFQRDDILIFILSHPDRIEFDQNLNQNFGYDFESKKIWSKNNPYLNSNFDKVRFFYETYHDELCVSNAKNVSFLYVIGKILNLKKVIVFHSFSDESLDIINFKLLNDENFFYYSRPLCDISERELYAEDYLKRLNLKTGKDVRVNHLSKDNHLIMYDFILNIIKGKETNHKFKENFRSLNDTYVFSEFIYD